MLSTSTTPATASQYLPSRDSAASPNQQILPLTAETSSQDELVVGGCAVTDLVAQYGSPLYILDEASLRTACRQYREAWREFYSGESLVIYASKAWNCLAVDAIVRSEELGIDVVSGGELATALQAGFAGEKIYFHGNNKSQGELALALESGVTIVADNWWELENIVDLVGSPTTTGLPPAKIMVRLTPGIECHTHEYIRTGHLDSKFGFDPHQIDEVFAFFLRHNSLNLVGLHAHIGSQIFEQQPHRDLAGVMVDWFVKARRLDLPVREINVGGGLGIKYTENDDPQSIVEWVRGVAIALNSACAAAGIALPKVISEPGRSLIGSSCITAYTIGSNKEVPGIRKYIAIDGGMSDNPRPITYQSKYRALIANKMSAAATEKVTIAGKHCESGDILIHDAELPPTAAGDILVVPATGAYNYSMASNYNRVPRPAAIVVKDGHSHLIIRRETAQDLLQYDLLPDRLQ
jgi:diaminopimelate decarboxylase